MATLHSLTLVPYLQRWDNTTRRLSLRVLVTPTSNPLKPLVATPAGVPAFADATFAFSVKVSDAIDALPQQTLVSQIATVPAGASGIHHPDARAIFEAIETALDIPQTPAGNTFSPQDRDLTQQVRKYLPRSYRQSFPFVRPRTSLAVVDDTYHCLMRCPPDPEPPTPPMVIGWGEALAFALRRPRLAEALGLIVPMEITVDPAPRLEQGGWLWVELDAASDYAAQSATPGFARSFATRVPALPAAGTRPIFTPVVFPVSANAAEAATRGNYDKVFVETLRFDDGFSKIVHARQPLTSDVLDEAGAGAPIARDEGIQLGWDDEDILEGQNRALGAPPDGEDPVLAPRGVLGYRVDVRAAGGGPWTSLSLVQAPLDVGVDLGNALEERWTEVVPTEHSQQLWLPAWYANWRGGSLVVSTNDEQRLMNVPPGPPEPAGPVGADAVELRYGRRYDFRVRLADTTGGGPDVDTTPVNSGEAPTTSLHVRRHRTPADLDLDQVLPPIDGKLTTLRIRRPRLGFPEAVFAAGASARSALLAQIAANDAGLPANAVAPTIPDPDTALVHVRVLVRPPTFDPSATDEGYVEWYSTTRAFPANAGVPLDLPLTWHDTADYRDLDLTTQLGAEGAVSGPLLLATARDIRLELRALGRADFAYFANDRARRGPLKIVDLHGVAAAAAEVDVLRPLSPADQVRSVFMRPDPNGDKAPERTVVAQNEPSPALLSRLAASLDLVADGPMLLGNEGDRVAFGCAGLNVHAAPDFSSLEFADSSELAGQWINAVQVLVGRDWTWRGAGSPTLVVTRTVTLADAPGAPSDTVDVGSIELMHAVNVQAARRPQRTYTRLLFLDAVPPRRGADGLPYEMTVRYGVRLHLEGGSSATQSVTTRLPIVSRPTQVPKVVAAGIALTPYAHDAEYASTSSRIKHLWIEFAEPLADARDAWFAKPLYTTPDPMLLSGSEPLADPQVVEGPALDPELVRVITPGQPQDLSGLATMQRLEPSATSPRHFLVPLPPNMDPGSPELFSFYTYEIRAGHDRGPAHDPLWSTAQGRFGEPLVLEGVQHPAPELSCTVLNGGDGDIRVRAPFAAPYVGLRRMLPMPPNTELWAALYAQVVQADAAAHRNVLIDLRRLEPQRKELARRDVGTPRLIEGQTRWSGAEIAAAVAAAGLPANANISVLAIELLPEPNGTFGDPLGGDLGNVRILRTSPLAPVVRDCCTA